MASKIAELINIITQVSKIEGLPRDDRTWIVNQLLPAMKTWEIPNDEKGKKQLQAFLLKLRKALPRSIPKIKQELERKEKLNRVSPSTRRR